MEIEIKKVEEMVTPHKEEQTCFFDVLITETHTDEAGNAYDYTRKERVCESMLNEQKAQLQAQIDVIDEKLAQISKLM